MGSRICKVNNPTPRRYMSRHMNTGYANPAKHRFRIRQAPMPAKLRNMPQKDVLRTATESSRSTRRWILPVPLPNSFHKRFLERQDLGQAGQIKANVVFNFAESDSKKNSQARRNSHSRI